MALFRAFGSSEQGPVRQTNEDCFALDAQRGLCIVADGMGGHNGGEVASRLAVDGVTEYVRASGPNPAWPFGFDATLSPSANVLRTAVFAANRKILEAAAGRSDLCGMGTTIVAGQVHGSTLAMAHVGDSRLYIFAAGALRLRTRDDSWALNRNVLTNVLGSRPEVEVHMAEEPIHPGDLVILTTDGVHGVIDDGALRTLVAADDHPQAIANRLVQEALSRGSRDNCTAVVGTYNSP
jgi:serine/threonine protein phosphatase PrpC